MPRFTNSTQKYDEHGNKIPKGRNGLKIHLETHPHVQIFDSKSEYELYLSLKEQEQKGLIHNLQCKVKYILVHKRTWFNNVKDKIEHIRELAYISDFVFHRNGNTVVLDCKGWKYKKCRKTGKEKWHVYYDEIYKIKKKLFLERYPDIIFEEM